MKEIKCFKELNEEFIKVNKTALTYFEPIVLGNDRFDNEYLKLTLLLDNEINDRFIINKSKEIKEESKISINLEDIIFRTFNGKLFFEIKDVKILNYKNPNIKKEQYNIYCFTLYNYINSLDELKQLKSNCLVSIPMRVKESESYYNEPLFKFKDINKEILTVDIDTKKFNVEGNKIYILESFLFNKEDCRLEPLLNSNIKEIDDFLDKDKNYDESDIYSLFNFKGKIKTFNFINKKINIEIEGKKELVEVEINDKLFSKISIDSDCYFYHFSKINENKYKFNHFSNIQYNQKTFIILNFVDYLKDKYYTSVQYDEITKEIKGNNLTFEINENTNRSIEIKEISFLKKDENNNIIDKAEFTFEINIGKKNKINSLSKKTEGFSYQIYYESYEKESLPKIFKIKDENNLDINIEPENNENEFFERFTIINVPYQNIIKNEDNNDLHNFSLNQENNQDKKEKNIKYLFTINNKNTSIHKFILKKQDKCENFYDKFKQYEDKLQAFFQEYFPKDANILHRDIFRIKSVTNSSILNIFNNEKLKSDLSDVIHKGFNKYYFYNCRKDYILMRNIYFAFFCLSIQEKKKMELYEFLRIFMVFKSLLLQLSMEYIDRIKALIAILREFIYRKFDPDGLQLKIAKSKSKNSDYPYYIKANEKFLNIINNLTENCALYKGIRQFNGIILTDELSQKEMYSGSILNIKDIQFELFKYSGEFCIIQQGIPNLYGSYWPCARTMFLNPDTLLGGYYKNTNNNEHIIKRATAGTLFIKFHEITGHLKTHVNSENNSPEQVYVDGLNLTEIKMDKPDSGFLFEYILAKNYINCKYFMNSSHSEELLDENLYLSESFDQLKEKFNFLQNALSPITDNKETVDNEKKTKYLDELINDVNLNYNRMTINELFIFFSNLDPETKEKMKESEAYSYYLSLLNDCDKKI